MARFVRPFLLASLALTALAWLVKYDHDRTRPARVDVAACRDNMVNVCDTLLLYEQTYGALPRTLDALVPQFATEQMLCCREGWKSRGVSHPDRKYRYVYDPAARRLADPMPHAIRGLMVRHAPIRSLSIPRQAVPAPGSQENKTVPPPARAIMIEAETFSEMNHGWEIVADPAAGQGAYLENKEGVANHTAVESGFGDFYNVGNDQSIPELYYTFRISEAGTWNIQSRVRTTGTHCSNLLKVFLDGEELGCFGGNDIVPFSWTWDHPKTVALKAGLHEIRVYPWEDGVSLDQIVIAKAPVEGAAVFRANALPEPHGSNSLFVVHNLDTCVLDLPAPPRVTVWLRQTQALAGHARLRTTLLLPNGGRDLLVRDINLSASRPLLRLPIDLDGVDRQALPRREYLLKSVLSVDGKTVCTTTTALLKPFQWQVLGMLPFSSIDDPFYPGAEVSSNGCVIEGKAYVWQPFESRWRDAFGLMDFGLMYATNSLFAPPDQTVYARTRFKALRGGQYLFKSLSDDQMILSLDGQVVDRIYDVNCAPRTARRTLVRVFAGEHTLRYSLNQYHDRWQAGVFIRSRDDSIATDIVGME